MDIAVDFTHKVSLIRYIGDTLMPVRFTIRTDLLPREDIEDVDFDIAFTKIKFWLDTIVSRCIVFSRSNEMALDMLLDEDGKPRLMNHLMITPDEPNDDHLAVLFQSKMTALAKGKIIFGCVRMESNAVSALTFTYVGDSEEDLPSMEEWFERKPYYFDAPWWTRDDTSTLDLMPVGEADFTARPAWAATLDFIEEAIRPTSPKSVEEVVIRGSFKPKVINGGRDEK